MPLDLHEAVTAGVCDYCHSGFVEGDFVAQPNGDEVMCPTCIMDHMILESS